MRIGLFTAAQWSSEENPAAVLKALREQVRAARDNGFSSLFVGQHLLTGPMGMFQTNPLLGHLVDDAAGMQIGPGVLLLSMMNPVLAAEEAATLDWLSDGNYVLGAGLGYRPEEFQAMGVDQLERVGRLTEGLEVIKRLWTGDRVVHHGRYFRLDDVQASVRPKQRPRPPIWLGGSVEPAVRRAARIADAWCIAPTASTKAHRGGSRGFLRRAPQDRPAGRRRLPVDPRMLRRSQRRARQGCQPRAAPVQVSVLRFLGRGR